MGEDLYRSGALSHTAESDIGTRSPITLQHPNTSRYSKHTARIIKKYLENNKRDGRLTVLNWPAQSPDMNIIEKVWTYIEKEKVKRAPVNLQQLWEVLQDISRNIPDDFIQKLYESVPRRVNDTKY